MLEPASRRSPYPVASSVTAVLAASTLALTVAAALLGCGTSCEEIRADRAAFEARPPARHTADGRVTIPFPILDRAIAAHLAERPPVTFPISLAQVGLKLELAARLDAVTTRADRPGKLGLTADIGLYEGRERVADVRIDTSVTPRYEPAVGDRPAVLGFALRSDDLARLRPRTTPAARDRLAEWLRRELPAVLRELASKELVGAAADELLEYFGRDLWPEVKGRVLGPDHELFATSVALPKLPLAGVSVRSREGSPGAMIVDLATTLPIGVDLPADDPPVRDGLVTFRLTGESAAELVNVGMAQGLVPGRFDGDGKPDARGQWEARLGWRRGDRPLVAHLWQTSGSCKRARLGGALRVAVKDDKLGVEIREGRVEAVRGSAFTEAFAWLDALWTGALDLVFELASFTRAEVDGGALSLRVREVGVDERALTVGLEARLE